MIVAAGQVIAEPVPSGDGWDVTVVRGDGSRRTIVAGVSADLATIVAKRLRIAVADCERWALDLVDVSAGELRS